jgi:catechol 2,3-dioxygenase-like lactoylglutathione lyase family enzyme
MSGSRARGAEVEFGFDHVVIAVRDLPGAIERYTALGFHVEPGGRHPGFGTANALIQLDNGYIELLAVEDAEVALGAGIRRREVVEYLERQAGGLIGYALTCDSLAAVRRRGGRAEPRLDMPPLEMSRIRPDGSTLRWRLLVPGGSTWCRPWPFLIEWEAPEGPAPQGPAPEGARGPHANGALAVDAIVVGTTSLSRVTAFFRENLGLAPQSLPPSDDDARPRSAVGVGGCRIEFVEAPDTGTPGPLASTLDGEGPEELRIQVASVDAAAALLQARGISVTESRPHLLRVDPDAAAGARIAFVDA